MHIDDVGEAYVAAAKRAPMVRGMIFNIANGYDYVRLDDLLLQCARLAGYKGELHWVSEYRGWHDEFIDASVVLSNHRAVEHLGWTPKIYGLMENLEFYYEVFKASKDIQ